MHGCSLPAHWRIKRRWRWVIDEWISVLVDNSSKVAGWVTEVHSSKDCGERQAFGTAGPSGRSLPSAKQPPMYFT